MRWLFRMGPRGEWRGLRAADHQTGLVISMLYMGPPR